MIHECKPSFKKATFYAQIHSNDSYLYLISGKTIFPVADPRLGCTSDGLVTKLGNGAIPGTSGNPVKSLEQKNVKL